MTKKISLRLLVLFVTTITLLSCQSDTEKADKLRLENKFDEAVALYQKAADAGDAYAMWRLSNAYGCGDGIDRDEVKALELLKKSADAGCEEAKCFLAEAYIFDWYNIGKDTNKGKKMLDDLVKTTSNSTVLSEYAILFFMDGSPYGQDDEKVIRILKKVEDKNNPYYLYLMGGIYECGTDKIEINAEKAIEYYTKAFENGIRRSASRLVGIYYNGCGNVKADKAKVIEWLNRGIESNETDCMNYMANFCLSEDSTYHDLHNPQRAVELYRRAAKHGEGSAFFKLGNLYFDGEFLPKDDKKAFENWKKGCELKNDDATSNLAYCYIYGVGCEKDEEKGIEFYKLAVKYGSGFSANNLYECYLKGAYGVEQDIDLAKEFLLKAAELEDPNGCYRLGLQYYLGKEPFSKNESQAFVYMKKAADKGHVDACGMLALFYERGIGVDKDPKKAKEYKDKTRANNDEKK